MILFKSGCDINSKNKKLMAGWNKCISVCEMLY